MESMKWRWQEGDMTVTRTTPWTGPGCHNGCGLLVYSKDNRIIKVEGDPETPFSQGRLCPRCLVLRKVVHHPDRLTHPLKRVGKRGEGKWERISWDEAYDTIVDNVRKIQKEYGPEAISVWHGTGRNVWHLGAKLCYSAFGSPNVTSLLSGLACYGPKIVQNTMTAGFLPLPDCSQMFADRYYNPNWKNPECLIIWGNNPFVAHADSVRGDWFIECLKRGSKLIVIDPMLTWAGSRADIFLQLRPGTDAAVALGMLHIIIGEELYDKEFVEKWTEGFDRLKERVKEFTPERVEEISWVPKEKLIAAARLYASSKPAAIQWGVTVEQHKNGMSNILAIQALWGVTGNVDVPGGNILSQPEYFYRVPRFTWGWEDIPKEMRQKRIGAKEYPLVTIALCDLVYDAIEYGKPYPLKMAWLQGTNPIATIAMDPRRLHRIMQENMDFVVVLDLFMTPSAMAWADIVLPVASALERDSIRTENYGNAWWGPLRAVNKVIQLGECKSDEQILLDVGKRLNPKAFPWENVDEMLDFELQRAGITIAELREQGIPYYPFEYKKYEKGLLRKDGQPGFNTVTGKFMFYMKQMEDLGLDPLPFWEEPPQSPVSTPELFKEYPLVLTTGARRWGLFHSEHRQIPEMRQLHPDPEVIIHPDTAREYGIKDGDWVWIENNYGKCRQRAKLYPGQHPKVVNAAHGWWYPEKPGPEPSLFGVLDVNVNQLLKPGEFGPTGFCAPYKSNICKIYKAREVD